MSGPRLKPSKLQLPTLDTGPVPLISIREQARRQLLEVVDSRRGRKALVLDPALAGALSLLDTALPELLAEHGVAKLLYLEQGASAAAAPPLSPAALGDARSVLFLARPSVAAAQAVAAAVKGRDRKEPLDCSLFFVPRRTLAAQRVLEEEGVLGDLAIGEYGLDMVPYEDDVLSLELEGAFAECVLEGDPTPLYYTAAALARLQGLYGVVPRVQGKGPAASAVRDMCARMRRENPGLLAGAPGSGPTHGSHAGGPTHGSLGGGGGRIDRMILLDREVDVVTPLMTQITFEGLIDEVTGIKHGSVPWASKDSAREGSPSPAAGAAAPASSSSVPSPAPGGRTLLNSTDPYFREFRDLPFHVTVTRLQKYALEARREYAELGSKDLGGLKLFVRGLPRLPLLDRLSDVATPPAQRVREPLFHERLAAEQAIVEGYEPEASVAFIEELMFRGGDLVDALRLAVLLAACSPAGGGGPGGGLPRRQLEALRGEVLATYGGQHVLTLANLERAGLLRAATPSTASRGPGFAALRKALNLIVPEQEAQGGQQPAGAGGGGSGSGAAGGGGGGGAFEPAADVSHLYKGYAPISIRLVEAALRTGWGPLSEVLQALPGNHFDIVQTVDANGMPVEKPYKASAPAAGTGAQGATSAASGTAPASGSGGASATESVGTSGQHIETVLVVFIGGVTFAEISALRWLSSRPEWPYRFLVLTTKIVNGRTLLQPFIDPVAVQLGESVGLQT